MQHCSFSCICTYRKKSTWGLRALLDNFFQVKTLVPILACKDRSLRIMHQAKLSYSVNIEGVPSFVIPIFGDGGDSGNDVIFATTEGIVGLVKVTK